MIVHDVDFTDRDIQEFIATQESQDIRSGAEFKDQLVKFAESGHELNGIRLPWAKTHDKVRLRGGEVSIWAGINGHFKSSVVGQVSLWAARETKVGIMSFELPVAVTMFRMAKQASGSANPAGHWCGELAQWMDDKMYFYDRLDSVAPERVLGCVLHMARLGVKLVVIDCLIMVKGICKDYERESAFMSTLAALAKTLDIHIAVVHHVRKPDSGGDKYKPTRFDVRGAGELVDMCSTLFMVWHDKSKNQLHQKIEHCMKLTKEEEIKLDNTPDLTLRVDKHRHGEFEGVFGLYIHRQSMQCVPDSGRRPMPFDITC